MEDDGFSGALMRQFFVDGAKATHVRPAAPGSLWAVPQKWETTTASTVADEDRK